jgi:hypothetical protein
MMLIATGPDGDEHVTAFNPQYRFTIVRYKGASDWKIEQIEPTSTPSYVYDITRYISSGINDMPQGETLEKKDSILELLGSTARNIDICAQTVAVFSPSAVLDVTKCTDFKPTSARWEVLDGRKVVAVEISWRLGKLPLQATIWCDPKVDWAVVKWHRPVSIMNMGAFTHTVEYEYDENAKMPIVKKVTTIGNDNGSIEETIFSEFSDKPFPARDFTLGAFGLPEPPGLSYRGGTWYVWISIGALAVILLMLWRRSTTMGKA